MSKPQLTRNGLEYFIRFYIPKGWVGPIMEFDFAPHISDEDFKTIMMGDIPSKEKYDKWYVRAAIEEWRKNNG